MFIVNTIGAYRAASCGVHHIHQYIHHRQGHQNYYCHHLLQEKH